MATCGDWKGDLVPSAARIFGKHIPIAIPLELVNEPTLLAYLGLGSKELKKIWWYRGRMYQHFPVSKGIGKGKVRSISAPDRRLKILQTKLVRLLNQLYLVRNPVHGFVPERSVKTNAEAHGRRQFVVNLDLQDFFPTITENRVRGVLCAIGVDRRVAEIVARLCCLNDHLPQGAPTSPVISNMICYRLDTELLRIAKSARAIYTRYADDISFSSYQPPAPLFDGTLPEVGRFSPELLAPVLREAFQTNGFVVNPDKTHYADRNSRRIITGVKINSGLNVDRRFIRHIRALLHSVETLGLSDAQKKYAEKGGKGSLMAHIRGKISYVNHLKDPTDPVVRALASRYNKSFPGQLIKLMPTREEQCDRAVWVVDHLDHYGSAFFLKGIGLVTAAHCVASVEEAELLHPSRHATLFKTKVLKRDDHRDLAILDHTVIPVTEYFELKPAALAASVGDEVTACGYPDWAPGDRLNHRPGHVSLLTPKAGVRKIEVTQALTQGMSGGPILNSNGEVVGIIYKGGPEEGRQLATDLRELQRWLEE